MTINDNDHRGENRAIESPHPAMQGLSLYNASRDCNRRESRLRKCASIIQSLPIGHLLDIGCSNGEWALRWKARGCETAGLDINRDNVAVARSAGNRGALL
jgi:2-polyprenyl-3-methyl-5-hydroxy-6-metoxy-1,4-benzoquinol methylase